MPLENDRPGFLVAQALILEHSLHLFDLLIPVDAHFLGSYVFAEILLFLLVIDIFPDPGSGSRGGQDSQCQRRDRPGCQRDTGTGGDTACHGF